VTASWLGRLGSNGEPPAIILYPPGGLPPKDLHYTYHQRSRFMATKQPRKKRRQSSGFKRLPKGPHGGIELLLIHSVPNLGKHGEVVEVKPGYAKNYLIPQGLATIATDHHKRMVEKHKEKLEQIERQRLAELENVAEQLGKLSVTIEANANDEGHLYGSVSQNEIAAALKQNEFTVSPEQIKLEGPLKELGLYTVRVRISPEVEGELKVWVVPAVSEQGGEAAATS